MMWDHFAGVSCRIPLKNNPYKNININFCSRKPCSLLLTQIVFIPRKHLVDSYCFVSYSQLSSFRPFCCRWLLISGRQGCYDWDSVWLKDWLEPLKTLTHPLLARRRDASPFILIKPLSSKNPTYFTFFLWRRKIKSPAVWRRPLVFTLSWES